ncbi:MAG: hypothetical protein O3B64_02025 [bacterium]|nr:hypothetical protein [bacterium]
MKIDRSSIGLLIAVVLLFFGVVLLVTPEPEYTEVRSDDLVIELSGVQSIDVPLHIEQKTEQEIRVYTLLPEGEYADRDLRIEIQWELLNATEDMALYQFDPFLRVWRFLAQENISSLTLDLISPIMIAPAIPEAAPIFASDHSALIASMPRHAAGVDIWSELFLAEGYPVIVPNSEYQGGCSGEYFVTDRAEFSSISHTIRLKEENYQLKTAARFSLIPEPLCTIGDFSLRDFSLPDTL